MSSESTILRVDKKAGRWEAIPVALIADDRLGFDTRGFAVWLISKPDGWEIRAGALPYLLKDCTAMRGHVGRDKARRFLRELERGGYLVRTRALPHWSACRRLKAQEVFLLSSYSPFSFDSRYFGPVERASVMGRAVPLWTWR
jgi:hypothetical protein